MKRKVIAFLSLFFWVETECSWTQLNYNDAVPLISPNYPFDFLNSEIKADYAHDTMRDIAERVQISFNLFTERTDVANNQDGIRVAAGDVYGRIGLLAMSYGDVPTGQKQAQLLTEIAGTDFTFVTATMGTTEYADPSKNFGFLINPAQYKKSGIRMNGSVRLFENVVISIYGGVCDMRQSITGLVDQTLNANITSMGGSSGEATEFAADKLTLYNGLTRQWQEVLTQIGVNYQDWHEIGIEDTTIALTYRGNIPVQQEEKDNKWTQFLIIPHVTLSFTAALGDKKDPDILLSLPFGNNGHNGVSISAGCAFAFNDTIEVFGEATATQYFSTTLQMRVPTSLYQSGLYPYKTSVKSSPANSYQGNFGLNAHYFLDKLSGYVQAIYASHEQDNLALIFNDPAYDISRLEADTEWKFGAVNLGLNYDLSPNISLGGAAQLPMARKGAYLTNTFMIGMTATF